MPVVNRLAEMQDEIAGWRREIHAEPELLYDVHQTAARVASQLRAFGCDSVTEGIGRTGVVGVIEGRAPGREGAIGLRADMDALPITEATGRPYASRSPGRMHACGHDGHTAMLLGAAKYLAETRNFAGRAVVIFQPAEEGGAGGLAMVEDGLMERFDIAEVYGMHNLPGLPVGRFALRPGPIMASTDEFAVTFRGRGGHAAMPQLTADPVVALAHAVTALQTIVSRNTAAVEQLVVSVTQLRAGTAHNIIPETAWMDGTVRALTPERRAFAETRLREIVAGIAATFGMTAEVEWRTGYPVTINHEAETGLAVEAAAEVAGATGVEPAMPPLLGGEDFAYMLEKRPGAFIFIGNGDSAGLHTPQYDFNDEAIPFGASYWARLVERLRPAG